MRISLDPWGGDYGSQMTAPGEVDSEVTTAQVIGRQEEEGPWKPRTPNPSALPEVTTIIDGVMRVDAPAVVSDEDRRYLAIFGSYASGAVQVNHRVAIVEESINRLFVVGGGYSGADVHVQAGNGTKTPLVYRNISSPESTPDDLRRALMTEMRQTEIDIARKLSGPEHLVLADGNLTFLADSSSIVGVIKTIQRLYLTGKDAVILEKLKPGDRTPLFRFSGSSKNRSFEVYTCYLRLAEPRPIEHHYAGLVRLEVKVGLGVQNAVELLDQAAVKVVALASRAPKDPRAPQNLIPVGGLERQLRHKLGDPQLVRRGIERELLDRRNREA
ncbi:MAG: hypothetical protein FJ147_01310 [Deltaproteobacteria bacterium]|nr:hypothetical protein [Deltaproteobacteria bacterium]